MKTITTILSALLLISSLHAAENTLSPEEKAAGWKLLFDGKDASKDWRGFKQEELSPKWAVEDGALVRKGGGGDIVSKEKFDSFELSIDWKISEGGNSGIIFKVIEEERRAHFTGPEIQVLDNARNKDKNKAGWLYQFYPAEVDTTRPAGEWNTFLLKCQKTATGTYRCEHWMNGTKYCEYEIGSDEWKEKLADTKFAPYKHFATAKAGHIALQDHGNVVSFRNIKIRELPVAE